MIMSQTISFHYDVPGDDFTRAGEVSSSIKKAPPSTNPPPTGSNTPRPWASAISMAGINSDQTDAAIMTPAAKPKNAFCRI